MDARGNKASSVEKEEGHVVLPIRSCRHEAVVWISHSVREICVTSWVVTVASMPCVANRYTKSGHEFQGGQSCLPSLLS